MPCILQRPLRGFSAGLLGTALIGLVLSGCGDPVPEEQIAALGPEDPAVPVGPEHRPGQPCVLCHAGKWPGDAKPALSLGGTVYLHNPVFQCEDEAIAVPLMPAAGVEVHVRDSTGRQMILTTNAAGNFMLDSSNYKPKFPLWTKLVYQGVTVPMDTKVFRDGSCASCHSKEYGPTSAGPVHLVEDSFALEQFPTLNPGCPPP